MAEPSVQVPVSLIERAAEYAGEAGEDDFAGPAIARELRALLSEPTPSAEPMCTCGHEARTHDAMSAGSFACHVLECRCRTFTATPPSIADMAPGTRCREEVPGTVPSWAGEDQISPCLCVLDAGHDGRHRCDHHIDPSTIRDVTVPKAKV